VLAQLICVLAILTAPLAAAGVIYSYDGGGHLIKADYGSAGVIVYSYDPVGNLISRQPQSTSLLSVLGVASSTANSTYGVGANISIQVTFSGTVNVTGTPQLALNSGGAANYSSGTGSTSLTFVYTVAAGQSSAKLDYASSGALTLNGGTIKDAGGNPASLTLPVPGAAGSLSSNTNIVISTVNSAPSPVAASPASGAGAAQTFIFSFSDPAGWQSLGVENVLINYSLDGRNACYLAYSVPSNALYLVSNDGGSLLTSPPLGSSGSVGNGQCTVMGTGSSAVGSGNTLTLTLNMSFSSSFAGNKIMYMAARDNAQGNSGWQALGTWNVPGAVTFPSVGGLTPSNGSGSSQIFTFTFMDTKGYQDLGVQNVLINNSLDGRNACYLAYVRSTNVLYLVNDPGTALLPGLTLPGTGSISNSQCTVMGDGSSVSGNGNTLTLVLNVSFAPAFDGNRVIWMAARDSTDANNSGWQAMGTWTVQ